MRISEDQIEQIRRAHASARPKRENFAWWNTHRDLGIVLAYLEQERMLKESARKGEQDAQ